MDIVQLARCAFGHHKRDPATVVVGSHWDRGRCKGCGAAMVKDRTGWMLERNHPA